MIITQDTRLREINNLPEFAQAKGHFISGGGDFFAGENGEMTLAELQRKNPTWNANDIIFGLSRLQDIARAGGQYVYPVYSDPGQSQVQLFHLPAIGRQNGYFAILLAGGAYGAVCTMIESLPVAARLNELGVACFCLNYTTATEASFESGLMPKPLDDLAAAWEFIRANQADFHVQAEKYIVGGFSAGGNAAALWGTKHLGFRKYQVPAPRLLLLAYPLISLASLEDGPVKDYMCRGLFGQNFTIEDIDRYSANLHVDRDYPPVYLIHSYDDAAVPAKDTDGFAQALEAQGVRYTVERAETGGHGFGLGSNTPFRGWLERALVFLDQG